MLGLQFGKVKVTDYDEQWPIYYQKERNDLKKILGSRLIEIEHVGSTSVPSLPAKPIIDISICISGFEEVDNLGPLLKKASYTFSELLHTKNHILYEKNHPVTTHHLHIYPVGSDIHHAAVTFRDALRGDTKLLNEYKVLKENSSSRYKDNRKAYLDSKASFIQQVIKNHQ